MMTISRDGSGFLVKVREPGIGRFEVQARTLTEAHYALNHYYGGRPHLPRREFCPICRLNQQEEDRSGTT